MRRIFAVLTLTLLHAGLSFGVFLLAFGAGMARFDHGGTPSPGERLLDGAVAVLYFPLGRLAAEFPGNPFPGLWGYLPLLLNGALWAAVLVLGTERLLARSTPFPSAPLR